MFHLNPDYKSRFRILKGGKISLVVSALLVGTTLMHAAPSGGVVTSGTASIAQSGLVTNITQSTQKAAINWNNFSIANNEVVNFNQPNVSSITLNRVVGNEKSIIDGALNANGQVFILNSNGLLFSKNASINTAGLVATTMNLSDTDFMNGNYNFKGDSQASIINQGTINISDKGYATLFGKEVINEGVIKATLGKVHLTGASELTLNLNGNSLVNLTVIKGVLDALVENKGAIYADGGEVYLTTNAVNELLKGVVNNTGIIEAQTLDDVTGKIELYAHGGTTNVSGKLDATGGFVETSGANLRVADGTVIKAKKWLLDPTNVIVDELANGGTITAATIEANLNDVGGTGYIEIQALGGDITVNQAINIFTDNVTVGGLELTAGNNININNVITVGSESYLWLNHGWNGTAYDGSNGATIYGNGGAINMGMNAAKTDFTGKVVFNAAGGAQAMYINDVQQTLIRTASDLQDLSVQANGGNTGILQDNFVLAADIDMNGQTFAPIGASRNNNTYDKDFIGSFNGLGHTVSNLTISGAFQYDDNSGLGQSAGMFGNIATMANISSIRLSNASVTNTADNSNNWNNYTGETGALVGYARADGQQTFTPVIHNNIVTGSTVQSTGDGSRVGGVVGGAYGVAISDNAVTNTTVISNNEAAGGIVGSARSQVADKSTIKDSYVADSTIKAAFGQVGGVAGYASNTTIDGATVKNSTIIATSAVGGSYGAGGIVGVAEYASKIKNAAAQGNTIAAMQDAGGIVGRLADSNYDLDGDEPSTVTNSFYKLDDTKIGTNLITPSNNSAGVITYGGIYAAEYAAWLAGNKADLSAATFLGAATNGYYSIDNLADFKSMIALAYNPANNFKLAASFALDAGLYMPVLTGILDGNGKTITGLSVSQGYNSHIGLVGRMMGGTVKNLTLNGATLDGYAYVGGVAGYAAGRNYVTYGDRGEYENFPTISNVTVTGFNYSHTKDFDTTTQNIETYTSNIGSIAGYAEGATLLNLSATGTISATLTANNDGYDDAGFNNIGGLFGTLYNSSLDTASSNVSITATMISQIDPTFNGNSLNVYSIGGLAGDVSSSIIQNVSSSGAINLTLTNNDTDNGGASIESLGGLFGQINGSYVKNATSTNTITLAGNMDLYAIGGISGDSQNTLYNTITTSGAITLTTPDTEVSSVGGMIGYSDSDIIKNANSTRNIIVTADYASNIGGLIGEADYTNIDAASYTGTLDLSNVASGESIGGLVGYNSGEIDSHDYYAPFSKILISEDANIKAELLAAYNARADVIAFTALGYTVNDNSWGNNGEPYYVNFQMKSPDNTEWGVIKNATATVNIKAPTADNVGGLVGYMDASDGGQIINSSVAALNGTGKVLGGSNVGGLVGYNSYGNITDSHAAIEVVGNTDYDGSNVGGLVGYNEGSSRTEYLNVQNINDSFNTTPYATQEEADAALASVKQAYINSILAANPGYVYNASDWDIGVTQFFGQNGFFIYGSPEIVKYNPTGVISNSYATGKVTGGENVGGLVGYNYGEDGGGAIIGSHATGAVSGTNYSGGLVGYDEYGTIDTAYATGTVNGTDSVGGLVGYASGSTILDSYHTTGKVTAQNTSEGGAGGLVGVLIDGSSITNSYATSEVAGEVSVGGLVGAILDSNVETSYASGKVSGDTYIGGLVGTTGTATITNAYAVGNVTGNDYVGGLSGGSMMGGDTITNTYASGTVTSTGEFVGGLIGTPAGMDTTSTVTASFYNTTKNPTITDNGFGTGKTTAEMNTLTTYSDAEWDIVVDSSLIKMFPQFASSGSIWRMNPVATIDPGEGGTVTPPAAQNLEPIVSQIVNSVIRPPVIPTFTPPAPPAPSPQQFSFGGQPVQLMSTPSGGTPTQVVSMQEVRQMQQESGGNGGGNPNGDIRVPLMAGSLIDLVNGGVRLPNGVEQEFFMAQR